MVLDLSLDVVLKPLVQVVFWVTSPHESFLEVTFAAGKPKSVVDVGCERDKLFELINEGFFIFSDTSSLLNLRSCLRNLLELRKSLLVLYHKEHQVLG